MRTRTAADRCQVTFGVVVEDQGMPVEYLHDSVTVFYSLHTDVPYNIAGSQVRGSLRETRSP